MSADKKRGGKNMGRYEPYQLVGICAGCGMPLKADSTGAFNKIFDGRHYFCNIE